jgi:hypothetical protein
MPVAPKNNGLLGFGRTVVGNGIFDINVVFNTSIQPANHSRNCETIRPCVFIKHDSAIIFLPVLLPKKQPYNSRHPERNDDMICAQCGRENTEPVDVCEHCGAPVGEALPGGPAPGLVLSADGIIRWVYELNMWKNPTLALTIWKSVLLAAGVPALLMFFLSLSDGAGFEHAFLLFVQVYGGVAGVLTGLLLLAYPLVALVHGGKYCVVFEMNDTGVRHIQMRRQFKKSQVLAVIVTLAGAASGSLQTAGAGMLAGSHQSLHSRFEKVKSIVVNEKRQVLYVDEALSRNQVYAEPDAFAFVCDFVITRCKNAKVTYR